LDLRDERSTFLPALAQAFDFGVCDFFEAGLFVFVNACAAHGSNTLPFEIVQIAALSVDIP